MVTYDKGPPRGLDTGGHPDNREIGLAHDEYVHVTRVQNVSIFWPILVKAMMAITYTKAIRRLNSRL